MESHSELSGDSGQEHDDVASMASRPSGVKIPSGPQSPAESAEPADVETKERGSTLAEPAEPPEPAEADEPAEPAEPAEPEPREGPSATEAEGEEVPEEREAPAEAEEVPGAREAPAEEPAAPVSEGGPEGAEEERAEAPAEEEESPAEEKKKASSVISLAEASPVPEAEREGSEEEAESEGSARKSLLEGGEKEPDEDVRDEDVEWTEEVQRQQEQQLRSELLEQYRTLTVERSHYQRYNMFLQQKIYEALRKKKGLDAAEVVPEKGAEPEAPEKEEAYLRHLALLEELRKQEADDLDWYHQELDQLKQQCKEKVSRVEREWRRFQALKKQVVLQAMGSCRLRGGRQAALLEVEQIQALEDKKEKEMSAVRLENVQLKQSLVHFETRMRAQEDTTEGLLLIDFEQLKIENQTFNEKLEERNEELLKLHGKVNNNVQIITHVKEKLHFMDIENAGKKAQLLEVEAQVALRRDILTKTKQARDSLRMDNIKLNQKCGLLGKESLLRDMEDKVVRTEELKEHLESLKRHHEGLTLSCRGVRQKIRESKAFLPS
ncbi:coiled-coil domain-containing protein 96 [Pipistrellus kuhlii]|uniref:Coiled-coil domain containing 96 n=1 Tax=Pipistrellus kuhlii TaxID=59472 RepID=A0A7J8AYX0_PIPKU|nr:coiled-coil domain-containing protein 96 [Pipistrellus kuhlii]KAF6391481.1 coiled-coil domain containing 96 [Pipistrellus kuhlii]